MARSHPLDTSTLHEQPSEARGPPSCVEGVPSRSPPLPQMSPPHSTWTRGHCSRAQDPSSHLLAVHTAWELVCSTVYPQHCPWPPPPPTPGPGVSLLLPSAIVTLSVSVLLRQGPEDFPGPRVGGEWTLIKSWCVDCWRSGEMRPFPQAHPRGEVRSPQA